jgi:hypothetical protein
MPDWYLGQAVFSEQIQLYGDTFWRQFGSTLLWTFLAVWVVLLVVAILLVTLSRRAAPSRALVLYIGSHRRPRPEPEEKAPPRVA